MSNRTTELDLLAFRQGALDKVDPNNIDQIRAMWEACSAAREYIDRGGRLENLTWRLYSRKILAIQNAAGSKPGPGVTASNTTDHAQVSTADNQRTASSLLSVADVPDLESSSSSESIQSARHRKMVSQELHNLMDPVILSSESLPRLAGRDPLMKSPALETHNQAASVPPSAGLSTYKALFDPLSSSTSIQDTNTSKYPSRDQGPAAPSSRTRSLLAERKAPSEEPTTPAMNNENSYPPSMGSGETQLSKSVSQASQSQSQPQPQPIHQVLIPSSVVRGFSPSSVSVAPSVAALRDHRLANSSANLYDSIFKDPEAAQEVPVVHRAQSDEGSPKNKMFFIVGSSESDRDNSEVERAAKSKQQNPWHSTHPLAGQSGLKLAGRPTSSLAKSKLTVNFAEPDPAEAGDDGSDYESVANSESEWDDLSEEDDDEDNEMFQEQAVPLRPTLRPSLLSSLFLNKQAQVDDDENEDEDEAGDREQKQKFVAKVIEPNVAIEEESSAGPAFPVDRSARSQSTPVIPADKFAVQSPGSSSKRSADYGSANTSFLHRFIARAQPSQSVTPMTVGSAVVPVGAMLNAVVPGHIPYRDSEDQSYADDMEEVNDREMSESVKENLLQSRGFELESLWPQGNRFQKRMTVPLIPHDLGHTLNSQSNGSSGKDSGKSSDASSRSSSRRPSLNRAATMPVSRFSDIDERQEGFDSTSYHARGW